MPQVHVRFWKCDRMTIHSSDANLGPISAMLNQKIRRGDPKKDAPPFRVLCGGWDARPPGVTCLHQELLLRFDEKKLRRQPKDPLRDRQNPVYDANSAEPYPSPTPQFPPRSSPEYEQERSIGRTPA